MTKPGSGSHREGHGKKHREPSVADDALGERDGETVYPIHVDILLVRLTLIRMNGL